MQRLHPHKIGLVLAAFLAGWHLVWSVLVALGWAQAVIDFILWLHFVTMPVQVGAFGAGRALGLIVVTAAVGYVGGYAIAAIWNYVHRGE